MEWKDIFDKVLVSKDEVERMKAEYTTFTELVEGRLDKTKIEDAKKAFFAPGNAIASISNRPFWKDEPQKLLKNWESIAKELKELREQPNSEKYEDFQSYVITSVLGITDDKKTEKGKKKYPKPYASTLRLAASVLPEYLCSIASETDIDKLIAYLTKNVKASITGQRVFDKSHNLLVTIRKEFLEWRQNNKEQKTDDGQAQNEEEKSYYCLPWKILEYFKNRDCVEISNILRYNKNLILTGAPGTGKTYLARQIAASMIECTEEELNNRDQFGFVQFHPSYDYTDFVEGLRPEQDGNNVVFKRKDGIFKDFCIEAAKAEKNPKDKRKFVFVIDEINRGEISKIFGELFFSIDPGYREKYRIPVKTQYQNLIENESKITDDDKDIKKPNYYPFKKGFYVPSNVYVIGTMNDIDRSVESMDFAFRRRFAFHEIKALDTQESILANLNDAAIIEEAKKRMDALNDAIFSEKQDGNCNILEGFTSAYHIGAAYFKKIEIYGNNGWEELWNNHIKGVLFEYLRGTPDANTLLTQLKNIYDLKNADGTSK